MSVAILGRAWGTDSAVPFNRSDHDWPPVYSALMASPVPLVVSVGVLPVKIPASFGQYLPDMTSFYARLAREEEAPGGLYHYAAIRLRGQHGLLSVPGVRMSHSCAFGHEGP